MLVTMKEMLADAKKNHYAILGFDGSLNFFAGPLDKKFSANFNFYNVHYA